MKLLAGFVIALAQLAALLKESVVVIAHAIKESRRREAHDRIDADLDGHLADAGLRVVAGRREDGAPLDHVPGASGGLSEEVHRADKRDA